MKIIRGDIVEIDFGSNPDGSIQSGIRPAVVISNNKGNSHSNILTVVPLSSKIDKKRYLPTHIFVPNNSCKGLFRNSIALAEQTTAVNFERLHQKLGNVNESLMSEITKAVQIQIGVFEEYNR